MGIESGFSSAEEILAAKAEEIDRMNTELDQMQKEKRSRRILDIKNVLGTKGIDTTGMDQRDLVTRFVSDEAEGLGKN